MTAPVAWWITRNELRRMATDKALIIFGLALPVVIILLIGSTFGGAGRIHLGVLDEDGTASSAAVIGHLEGRVGVTLAHRHSLTTLSRDVRSSALDAGMVIPKGYGASLAAGKAQRSTWSSTPLRPASPRPSRRSSPRSTRRGRPKGPCTSSPPAHARRRRSRPSPRGSIRSSYESPPGTRSAPWATSPTRRRPTWCCSCSSTPSR